MRSPARFTIAGLLALALTLGVAPGASGEPETSVHFTSGFIEDLHCPNAPVTPPRPPGTRPPPPMNEQIPTPQELGGAVTLVQREPPALDRARIPDFGLRDPATSQPRPRRIAIWGDSHIAAGPFMAQLSDAIRAHNETVATRFLPPTMGRANVRLPTLHAYCIGSGWSTALGFTTPGGLATGPGLANRIAAAGPESYLWLDFRDAQRQPVLKRIQMVYRASVDTALTMTANDGGEQTVALTGGGGTQFLAIDADTLLSTLKFHVVRGELTLEGFILDYDQPPLVTFDVFGIPSSTVRGWVNADPAGIAEALHGETYDAVALEYGTNEGNEANFDLGKYSATLEQALRNMRQVFPTASCVLIGPPDRGILVRRPGTAPPGTDFYRYARIHEQIAAVQAATAPRFNCAFWNWQDYMGGPGGNYGWAYAEPSLMGRDLTHLTAAGYKRTGQALATSLGWMEGLFP